MSGSLVAPSPAALSDRAVVELLVAAETVLAEVVSPDDADELWRKVKAVEEAARLARLADLTIVSISRVRLRAKRRWGELLGPAETSRRPEVVSARNDP